MLHTRFPLPEVWRTDLPWFFLAIHTPIVTRERVVLRCGEKLVSLRPDDGAIEWQTTVDPEGGNGALFLAHQDRYITERARMPDCLATVLAVDAGGMPLWHTDLPAMLALGSAVVSGGELHALSLGTPEDTRHYRIDLDTGAIRAQAPLPWHADTLLAVPGGLLARNQSPRSTPAADGNGDPGLYRMRPDGSEPVAMLDQAVRYLHGAGDLVLAVSQAGPTELLVRAYDAGSLAPLWSAPAHTGAAAVDSQGLSVYHVAPYAGAEHGVLVARNARTGVERWRSAALPARILSISACGPILLCNHRKGQVLYRCDDGALVAPLRGSYGPPSADRDRMYLGRPGTVLCASLSDLL